MRIIITITTQTSNKAPITKPTAKPEKRRDYSTCVIHRNMGTKTLKIGLVKLFLFFLKQPMPVQKKKTIKKAIFILQSRIVRL